MLPSLLISSWLWHLTRWAGLFLGTYLVTHLGGPPIANQLVGVAMFAPMLAGSYFSARADIDPRTLVVVTELVLIPVSVLMAVLVFTGAVSMWMVYPFELAYGFGGMVNMTAQRELLFRLSGPGQAARVLNIEVTSLAAAMMLGPLAGGVTISAFGLGTAFAVPVVLLVVSVVLFWRSTRHLPDAPAIPKLPRGEVNWRLLSRSSVLSLVLFITVICNLCYFAFLPLVPVIADHLNASAAMAGVIGATAGVVQLVVSTVLVVRPVRRLVAAYAIGVAVCLVCLAIVAVTPLLSVTLVALGVAGVGQALFGSAQATLPVTVVADHERATALGMLTTTIGVALPGGMVILGLSSSVFGAQRAMLLSAVVGLLVLAVTLLVGRRQLAAAGRLGGATGVGREGDSVAA